MKKTKRDAIIIRKIAPFAVATLSLLLGACATTKTPPPPGMAIIDAKPDPDFRKNIGGIALVSINQGKVKGTRKVIKPGLNTIKTRFKWPHGLVQQVDLRFYALPGSAYTIHYDVYPLLLENRSPVADQLSSVFVDTTGTVSLLSPLTVLPIAVIAIGERIAHTRESATYMDVVVYGHLGEGAVRQVRAYPDGRVDTKPWSAWAQIKAP